MTASIAALSVPAVALGSFAAKTLASTVSGFGDLFRTNSTDPAAESDPAEKKKALEDRIAVFQKQLSSRIRQSGLASNSKVEIRLDEFGLLQATANGQEDVELSRWLSGEADLTRQFVELQSQVAPDAGPSALTLQVDLQRAQSA